MCCRLKGGYVPIVDLIVLPSMVLQEAALRLHVVACIDAFCTAWIQCCHHEARDTSTFDIYQLQPRLNEGQPSPAPLELYLQHVHGIRHVICFNTLPGASVVLPALVIG